MRRADARAALCSLPVVGWGFLGLGLAAAHSGFFFAFHGDRGDARFLSQTQIPAFHPKRASAAA